MPKLASAILAVCLCSPAIAQRPPSARTTDRWQVDTSRSEKTADPTVALRLEAVSPATTTIRDFRPTLVIRCREGVLDVYVVAGSILRSDSGATPIRIRWGTGRLWEGWWVRSADRLAAFAQEPRRFLQQLLADPDVRIEVSPSDAGPVVITFNARGLDRHTAQLDAACPVKQESDTEVTDTTTVFLEPSGPPVFMESVVDERPEVLSVPALTYPDVLRKAGVQGRVLVQAIIDTSGRAEPRSVKVIQSPNPGFDEPAIDFVLRAMFRPARIHGRAVRVLVNLPIDFKIKH